MEKCKHCGKEVEDKNRLFSWYDVPGDDSERLLKFLKKNRIIERLDKPEDIKKSDNNKIITFTTKNHSFRFELNEKEGKVILTKTKEDEVKTYEYNSKNEGGKLNVYNKKEFCSNKCKIIYTINNQLLRFKTPLFGQIMLILFLFSSVLFSILFTLSILVNSLEPFGFNSTLKI